MSPRMRLFRIPGVYGWWAWCPGCDRKYRSLNHGSGATADAARLHAQECSKFRALAGGPT